MTTGLNLTAREVQQVFAEILSHGEDITWDLLLQNQKGILNSKIGEIFNFQFGKYTNGQSLSSLFFVLVVNGVAELNLAEKSRSWSIHPVFRCRRCVADQSGGHSSSRDCCMIYVDQSGIYDGWDTYLKQTALPEGIMVTCDRGIYKLIDGQVELKTYLIKGTSLTRSPRRPKSVEESTEGRLDLIRSANVIPTKKELQKLFKTRGASVCTSEPKLPAEPSKVPPNLLQIRSITVEGQDIQLADYGEAIIEHISSTESFEDLISSMAKYWKLDMCKLMLQMTQTFVESTRKELWLLLKYSYPTESVLYQIVLQTLKHHRSLNYKKVSEASPDILRSVRCFFVSCSPNCPPEFLNKCPKCVGYYNKGTRQVVDRSDDYWDI
ncbi:GL25254 [Drosophila persimilis]|uniref:GL25254 n=1 Tax=Drosophila persimilis TaxID=7234 RepID=B4GRS0_DROPE|nr:GL25254 [Drosophila persimilis]